ncbi:MAG: rhodanese-like domain-containing protein [Intestinibacillus sp.]
MKSKVWETFLRSFLGARHSDEARGETIKSNPAGRAASAHRGLGELEPATATRISAKEAKRMMEQGGAVVVDVRTPGEYAAEHIPCALLVPNEGIKFTPPAQLPDQEAVLLVYCHSGMRAAQAAQRLVNMGYRRVYHFGGLMNWPYETESGAYKH